MADILELKGEHRWLSNFWPAEVVLDGVAFPSVENAYQASKTLDASQREPFRSCTVSEAKFLGRRLTLRPDFDAEKVGIMRGLLAQKFCAGSELSKKLLATGEGKIVEGNFWGDVFWGVCRGRGKNVLGSLLMERRETLRQGEV
jgi:ribA/ribD-fused uncharacterized protein